MDDLAAARISKAVENAEIIWRILVAGPDALGGIIGGGGMRLTYARHDGVGDVLEFPTQEEALIYVAAINGLLGTTDKPKGLCVAVPVAKTLGKILADESAKLPKTPQQEMMEKLFGGFMK